MKTLLRPSQRLIRFALRVSLAFVAIVGCSCGVQPRPWGTIGVPSGQPILIGVAIDPQSPQSAGSAESLAELQTIATEAGLVHGHPIQLQELQVHCNASNPAAIFPESNSLRELAGVIGPDCSRACVYAAGVLYEARLTMVAPACTAAAVVQQGFPIVFRLAWDDDDQAIAAARYLAGTRHLHRVVIVRGNSVYSRSLASAFTREFKGRGRTTSEVDLGSAEGPIPSVYLAQVGSTHPDGIFLATDRADAASAYSQLVQGLPGTPVVGTDTVYPSGICAARQPVPGSTARQRAADEISSAACPYALSAANSFMAVGASRVDGGWTSDVAEPGAPGLFLDQIADAIMLYRGSLAKAGQAQRDGSLKIPRQAIRDALSHSRMIGRSGSIQFDPFGERRHDVGAEVYKIGPEGAHEVSSLHR